MLVTAQKRSTNSGPIAKNLSCTAKSKAGNAVSLATPAHIAKRTANTANIFAGSMVN